MKDPIELLARFAYQPNALKYCGPLEANKVLRRYIIHKDNAEEAKQVLLQFEALKPYLTFISEKVGKDIFDYSVVEAYCIGNSLLDEFSADDMEEIIKKLKLPKVLSDKLLKNVPACSPHHSFNVIHVGVGAITNSVKTYVENMSQCLIMWAKVKKVYDNELLVSYQPLEYTDRYWLGFLQDKKVKYDKEMLPVIVGDNIAIHWGFASMKLDNEQVKELKEYTLRNITAVNTKRI